MVTILPVHRPRVGLSVRADAVTLVRIRRGWSGRVSVRRVHEQALAPGLVNPSAGDVNLPDLEPVVEAVRALIRPHGIPSVAVSLPAAIAHLAVFAFDAWPVGDHERRALVQWRFQHDERTAPGEAVIAYRAFSHLAASADLAGGAGATPITYVLAVTVKRTILQQYQAVFERAGLFPVSIGLETLQLFDLYRSELSRHEESVVVHGTGQGFVCLALRRGIPVFVRHKVRRTVDADWTRDLLATLQSYDDRHPHPEMTDESVPIPVYQVGDGLPSIVDEATASSVAADEAVIPVGHAAWRIRLCKPELDRGAIVPPGAALSSGGLSALAGVVAA